MTKVELIRKVAKRNGVPDSEAKIFFEIFLQKVSSILQPAQALKLKGFGYFQLKKTVTKSSLNEKSNPIYSDVILYTPFTEEENQEEIIFNIPSSNIEKYNFVDSYFSLSFGKMVIPLQGVKDTDFFLPPTGLELKKLIGSKVNKLISESEIITDYVKGGEVLNLKNPELNEDQININWNENLTEGSNLSDKKATNQFGEESEFGHVAWDFGENLSKQIEEESILDTTSETSILSSFQTGVETGSSEWNFEEPNVADEAISNSEVSGIESSAEDQNSYDNFTTKEFDARVEDELKSFERVKSITSEFVPEEIQPRLTKSELDLSWDFGDPKIEDKHDENNDTNLAETNLTEIQDFKISSESIDHDKETNEKDKPVIDKRNFQNKNHSTVSKVNHENKTQSQEYSYSRKRSPFVFFIAMVTIITVSATVIFYITKTNLFSFTNKLLNNKAKIKKVVQADLIDRTFEVPVTYPYNKNASQINSDNEIAPDAVIKGNATNNSKVIDQKNNLAELLNNTKPDETVKPNAKISLPVNNEVQKAQNYEKVKENIFKSNNNFIVQVSSWRSNSIANMEMEKFKKRKLNSFVEKASLPGRGIWYRVKVGGFKTLSEAENFLNKNK
ncbi:MAG: HU family DNA-binding protein [Bacteroidetes bacterium]|nr:HU family DNA-binding protein [Bacteroidota bacterium]